MNDLERLIGLLYEEYKDNDSYLMACTIVLHDNKNEETHLISHNGDGVNVDVIDKE